MTPAAFLFRTTFSLPPLVKPCASIHLLWAIGLSNIPPSKLGETFVLKSVEKSPKAQKMISNQKTSLQNSRLWTLRGLVQDETSNSAQQPKEVRGLPRGVADRRKSVRFTLPESLLT